MTYKLMNEPAHIALYNGIKSIFATDEFSH